MESQKFHLGDILSVTTQRIVSPRRMVGYYDILRFMAGIEVVTLRFPDFERTADLCRRQLIRQHPQFSPNLWAEHSNRLDKLIKGKRRSEQVAVTRDWLMGFTAEYGEMHDVEPITGGLRVLKLNRHSLLRARKSTAIYNPRSRTT